MPSEVAIASADQVRGRTVEELERELSEAHRREAATAEVLRVISISPTDVQPVFDTIVKSAVKLCDGLFSTLTRFDGELLHQVAQHNYTPEALEVARRIYPARLDRALATARAILESAVVHIPDAELDREHLDPALFRAIGWRSGLFVPMLRNGSPIGSIAVTRATPGPFSDSEIDLLKTFADQAVIAIENTRLFEAEQARTRELSEALEQQTATSEVLGIISSSPGELPPVFQVMLQNAVRICDASFGVLFRFRDDGVEAAAMLGVPPAFAAFWQRGPQRPGPRTALGRVEETRRTVHIADVTREPAYVEGELVFVAAVNLGGFRTILNVPMLKEDELIGAFAVYRQEVRPFTDKQIKLVETFADQAVIAIENTRLFEEVQARTRELTESLEYQTATSQVLDVISRSPTDAQPVFDTIAESAARLCNAQFCHVFRFDGTLIYFAASHGITPEGQEAARSLYPMPPGRATAAARAILTGTAEEIPDVSADRDYAVSHSVIIGFRSVVAIPMLKGGRPIGAIAVLRSQIGNFPDRQIQLLKTFADQAVIAIENTRLFEEVQEKNRALTESNTQLTEAFEQQTATSEILRVISSSPTNVQPVFDEIARSAARLCEALDAAVYSVNGNVMRLVAHHGPMPVGDVPLHRGTVAGRTVIERRLIHTEDLQTEVDEFPEGSAIARQRGHRTNLSVPLLREDVAIGNIQVRRQEVRPFSDKQIALLETFADQAVIAIENTRLFNETKEALERQTATAEILRVIAGTPDNAQPVFDAIAHSALRLFGVSHVSIMLREGNFARCKATAGSADPRGDFLIELERSSTSGRSILDRAVINIGDTEAADAPSFARDSGRVVGFRAIAAAPMLREGIALGSVHVMRETSGPFTDTQIELLKTFADQAVIAIENARLFEEVQLRTRELARSVQELQALGEVGRAVSSTLDLKLVLKTIVERAVALSGTDAGSIFYYRKELGTFELGETTGLSEEFVARLRKLDISAKDTGPGESIAKRQPLQIPDLIQRPSDLLRDAVLEAGFRASLVVPLLSAEGPLGTLILRRRQPGEFSQAVVSLMQNFADQSVIALENARLFEEIAQKGRELEIASQHKSQFVANMSHELRTPLAAILGYAELMQEGFYGTPSEKSMDALNRIRSNGKHLLGLINTVLDIAKIESGQFSLNLGEYAIESVVETVRAATESLAETKKLTLKTDVAKKLPIGLGDEQRLTQVLLNLVGNAIKFTDTGEVRITATAMNGHFTVAVTDTGPGIPAEELKRVFEQFHQIDNSNTKSKGGTGLGLAIAKQIVEMHDGRIWVESTLGQGATFQMQLPIRAQFH